MTLDYRTMLTLDAVNLIAAVVNNEHDDTEANRIVGLYYGDTHELLHLLQSVTGIAANLVELTTEGRDIVNGMRDVLLAMDTP